MSTSKLCTVQVKHEFHGKCLEVKPITPEKVEPKRKKKTQPSILDNKNTVKYWDSEGERTLLIPSKEPNYYPITIGAEELKRLQEKATVLTEKERLKIAEDAKAEQERLENESTIRKNELRQFDKKGMFGKGGRLSALEREARDKANYLLKRAWELKQEEEDDVKLLNSLILQVKCQAIRDAQLAEHKLIQKEMKDEEKRLEQMMEDERTRQLSEEKIRLEHEKAKKDKYVKELNQQKEEKEAHRLLNAELAMEERKKANEAMFLVMLEELEEVRKKEEEKRKTREALNLANEQIKRTQEIEKEEQRLADLKVQEYMRMKAEREERFEREKEEQRKKREMEFARQRELQKKSADLQAIADEMAGVRRQEEYEREWRRKEKEAVKKKLKMEEDCRLSREQQMRDIRKYQAMEIAREKREFERNLKVQLEQQEKERLLELKRKHDAEKYRETILKQINQKELDRIQERQEKFQEGVALKAEEAKHKQEVKQILEKKIDNLRLHNVPEVYITDIQRRMHLL